MCPCARGQLRHGLRPSSPAMFARSAAACPGRPLARHCSLSEPAPRFSLAAPTWRVDPLPRAHFRAAPRGASGPSGRLIGRHNGRDSHCRLVPCIAPRRPRGRGLPWPPLAHPGQRPLCGPRHQRPLAPPGRLDTAVALLRPSPSITGGPWRAPVACCNEAPRSSPSTMGVAPPPKSTHSLALWQVRSTGYRWALPLLRRAPYWTSQSGCCSRCCLGPETMGTASGSAPPPLAVSHSLGKSPKYRRLPMA